MLHGEGTSSSLVRCKIHILHIIIHKRVLENNTRVRAHGNACACVCVYMGRAHAVCQSSVYHLGHARLCDRGEPIVLIPRIILIFRLYSVSVKQRVFVTWIRRRKGSQSVRRC